MATHRGGKKLSRRHTTVIEAALPLVDALQKHPCVEKIILGKIGTLRNGRHRIKIQCIDAGLRLTVRGTISIQTLYIYTKDSDQIEAFVRIFFETV